MSNSSNHVQIMISALAARPDLVHAQHFDIAPEIWDVCRELEEAAFEALPLKEFETEHGVMLFKEGYPDQPQFHRLPAPTMTMLIPDADDDPGLVLLEEEAVDLEVTKRWVDVTMIVPDGSGRSAPLGRIRSGDDPEIETWILDAEGPETNLSRFHFLLDTLPYLLALINTPRMTSEGLCCTNQLLAVAPQSPDGLMPRLQ